MARSPDLPPAPTEEQVFNPDPRGKTAFPKRAVRQDGMGLPTLWHQVSLQWTDFNKYWTGVGWVIVGVLKFPHRSMPPHGDNDSLS